MLIIEGGWSNLGKKNRPTWVGGYIALAQNPRNLSAPLCNKWFTWVENMGLFFLSHKKKKIFFSQPKIEHAKSETASESSGVTVTMELRSIFLLSETNHSMVPKHWKSLRQLVNSENYLQSRILSNMHLFPLFCL